MRRLLRSAPLLAFLVAGPALLGCHPRAKQLSPRDFDRQLQVLVARHDFAQAQRLVDERARQNPDDPDVYAARGNLYFRLATSRMSSRAGSGGRPDSTRDSSARTMGSSSDAPPGVDSVLARQATDALSEGIRRHPERLDMHFGLAFLLQALGRSEEEIAVLRRAVEFAKAHPEELRWSYGEPLPSPPDVYVPATLHDYMRFYIDRSAPGDEPVLLALAELSSRAYPRAPYALNDMAFYYGAHGDWPKSLAFLQQAERADSSDALVLLNLGWAYQNLGRRSEALHYYRRALAAGEAAGKRDVTTSASERIAGLTRQAP